MRSDVRLVTLQDLPDPPAGKVGWPWTEASTTPPSTPPGEGSWPRISIITPSYNQGRYIEETIRSVLLQGYPDLEYFIIDGGSTDETVDIIRKYGKWLAGWVSESDDGQSEAINKGFARSSGEIVNWLCSDDLFTKGALQEVAKRFAENPDIDVLAGACALRYDDEPWKSGVRQAGRTDWEHAPYSGVIWQPSCFFRRELVGRQSLVRPDLHYCMDRELWTYLWSRKAKWDWVSGAFSVFRFTEDNKSSVGGYKIISEIEEIHRSYFKELVPLPYMLRNFWLPAVRVHSRHRSGLIRFCCRITSRGITMMLLALYPRARVRALQRDFYHYGRDLPAQS